MLTAPDKYNIRHLNILAKVFNFKNLSELYPATLPKNDMIRLKVRITNNLKKDGSPSKKNLTEVVEIIPLNQ